MKILIIEDNEKLAKGLKEGLRKEGFTADFVLNGEAGQRRVEAYREDYDLVVLDLKLPRKEGLEILKEIRGQGINIPVLVLTAKDREEDKVLGLNTGADDYLTKPFSQKEFFARVRALLRRPKEKIGEELKIKNLVLNTANHRVFRSNKEIKLTVREFALLEYFMHNPGQVISREKLLSNLWDFDFDSLSNVVDVHIKNLRKKIDSGRKEKLLETVRGAGYRLRE